MGMLFWLSVMLLAGFGILYFSFFVYEIILSVRFRAYVREHRPERWQWLNAWRLRVTGEVSTADVIWWHNPFRWVKYVGCDMDEGDENIAKFKRREKVLLVGLLLSFVGAVASLFFFIAMCVMTGRG